MHSSSGSGHHQRGGGSSCISRLANDSNGAGAASPPCPSVIQKPMHMRAGAPQMQYKCPACDAAVTSYFDYNYISCLQFLDSLKLGTHHARRRPFVAQSAHSCCHDIALTRCYDDVHDASSAKKKCPNESHFELAQMSIIDHKNGQAQYEI
jgi:hypothetical protein